MPRKRKGGRVYWRRRGGERRAYADFRDFADVGGGREALVADDEKLATTDPDIAAQLTADRVKELEGRRRNKVLLGFEKEATLKAFASHHLLAKARAGSTSRRWMEASQKLLQEAVDFFGEDRMLTAVRVEDVRAWAEHLGVQKGRKAQQVSGGTIRHRLNVLSNLYRRAASEGYVPPGYNPVGALMDKPAPSRSEAHWLEVHDAALLLESARTYRPPVDPVRNKVGAILSSKPNPWVYPIFATFLLTGGRKSEVLGLEVDDVSFSRKTVTFRPNRWRRLKTKRSHRPVPLWPQLADILRWYMAEREREGGLGSLLFPSEGGRPRGAGAEGGERMVTDLRRALDAVATRAGWAAGEITLKSFRHTYTAARLQTLDRGAPVAPWSVARELGHSGTDMVEEVYGHMGQVHHRGEEVSYRVEDHIEVLGDRLAALSAAAD
ncbi:MAG: tyrosine-type recombinase/integrase [Longimicrobiales bacterium]